MTVGFNCVDKLIVLDESEEFTVTDLYGYIKDGWIRTPDEAFAEKLVGERVARRTKVRRNLFRRLCRKRYL